MAIVSNPNEFSKVRRSGATNVQRAFYAALGLVAAGLAVPAAIMTFGIS